MNFIDEERVRLNLWASNVVLEAARRSRPISRETTCIESETTLRRQSDIFYTNHQFLRKNR